MKALNEKVKDLLKRQKLKYWVNKDETSFRIPFIYEASHGEIKDIYDELDFPSYGHGKKDDSKIIEKDIIININISQEPDILCFSFTSEFNLEKLGAERTLMQLLKLNSVLRQGRIGIVEGEKHLKAFSFLHVPEDQEIDSIEFEKLVQFCMIVNDILTDAGIIEHSGAEDE